MNAVFTYFIILVHCTGYTSCIHITYKRYSVKRRRTRKYQSDLIIILNFMWSVSHCLFYFYFILFFTSAECLQRIERIILRCGIQYIRYSAMKSVKGRSTKTQTQQRNSLNNTTYIHVSPSHVGGLVRGEYLDIHGVTQPRVLLFSNNVSPIFFIQNTVGKSSHD